MTPEEREEWRNDMRQEAKEEEYKERLMRTDEDYFLSQVKFDELKEALDNFKKQCDKYGYDWSDYL